MLSKILNIALYHPTKEIQNTTRGFGNDISALVVMGIIILIIIAIIIYIRKNMKKKYRF